MRTFNTKAATAGISLAALLTITPVIVHAQTEPNDISSASSKYSATSVFVGGTPIMRVRFAADGYSPEQRAAAIQNRVNKLLGQGPITPDEITVQDIDNVDSAVYVKGQLLFTADSATAQFNQTSPHNLASEWADTMRSVLPSLTEAK